MSPSGGDAVDTSANGVNGQPMQILPAILSVLGALVGVALGGYLTMWIQKQHWVADNKKEEYRELISTLYESFMVIGDFYTIIARGPQEQRAEREAKMKAVTVIGTRIFIADDVKRLDLGHRWRKAVREIETSRDGEAFGAAVGDILADLTKSAKHMTD